MKKMLTMLLMILCLQVFAYEMNIITPNGGENYQRDQLMNIIWQDNAPGAVRIELLFNIIPDSINSGDYLIADSIYGNGKYQWQIPNWLPTSSTYRVKISNYYTGCSDLSDSCFTITGNSQPSPLTVTSPNGSETYFISQMLPINWNSNHSGNVKIELLSPAGGDSCSSDSLIWNSFPIIGSTPDNGFYSWQIPSGIEESQNYRIRISSLGSNVYDTSDNNFSIVAHDSLTGFITITSPAGGENFITNQQLKILWNDNLDENVRIDLLNFAVLDSGSYDSTATYCQTITDSTASNGEYNWTIPSLLISGQKYLIRIMSIHNSSVSATSSAYFSITRDTGVIDNHKDLFTQIVRNYPNPFNPTTRILFDLSSEVNVQLSIYNSKGELVKTLVNGTQKAGSHSLEFDGSNLNSGIYFYKLTTPTSSITQKMLLVK